MSRRHGPGDRVLRLVAGPLLALLLLLSGGALAIATDPAPPGPSPSATPAGEVVGPVDSRSEGEGPGLQVEPLVVLFGVLALGLAAVGGTWLYVRLVRED
jgi:hypothetical protein